MKKMIFFTISNKNNNEPAEKFTQSSYFHQYFTR